MAPIVSVWPRTACPAQDRAIVFFSWAPFCELYRDQVGCHRYQRRVGHWMILSSMVLCFEMSAVDKPFVHGLNIICWCISFSLKYFLTYQLSQLFSVERRLTPRGSLLLTLMIPWFFFWQHHEVDICGSQYNMLSNIELIAMPSCFIYSYFPHDDL